jgi:hypothetical protein
MVERNNVFSLVCKLVMAKRRSASAAFCRLIENDFLGTFYDKDREVFKKYFEVISGFFLFSGIRHEMHSEIRWCSDIVDIFLTKMNSSSNRWHFFAAVFESKTADGVLSLLEKGCEEISKPFIVNFTLQYPPNGIGWFRKWEISQALDKASSFRIPKDLLQILAKLSNSYLSNITMSIGSRLLFLLCTFINFVQSNHPHLCFLIDSYISNTTSHQLSIFLNVEHAQKSELQSFNELLYRFCRFSNPNTNFSIEKNFFAFFDLMKAILLNNNFLVNFSELLSNQQLINEFSELLSYKRTGHDFISRLSLIRQYPGFVNRISPCRNIYCSECDALLPPDRVEMCENCAICMHNHPPDDEDGW